MNDRGAILWLTLLAVALRWHDYGNPVIHVDEQYYLLVGDRMLHGAWPYLDIWDRKPIGLFAIFAAIRLLHGDGVLAYQVVATLFAAATAWLVRSGARKIGAAPTGALMAGVTYLIWLPLFSGQGGQSPIFFNLFMAGAAVLTLRLPALTGRRAIVGNGALVCLLAGLAIQTKYTPAVEGAFLGLVHVHYLRKHDAKAWERIGAIGLWIVLGLLPTLVPLTVYLAAGPAAFDAFWFANFASIVRRAGYSYPVMLTAGRLAGTIAKLAPLAVLALIGWHMRPRGEARTIVAGWLLAALTGYIVLGTYFDHYALPLILPFAMLAGVAMGRYRRWGAAVLAAGVIYAGILIAMRADDGPGTRRLAQFVAAYDAGGCPYVHVGDSVIYHLARACLPTRYAFPSMLAYAPEAGAIGIDTAAEVTRIMAARPPVVVTADRPLADWNPATYAIVARALASDYRVALVVPRDDYRAVAYVRRAARGAR